MSENEIRAGYLKMEQSSPRRWWLDTSESAPDIDIETCCMVVRWEDAVDLARKILEREGCAVLEGEEARDHQQHVLLRRVLGNDLARRGPIEPLPHMDRTHRPQAT